MNNAALGLMVALAGEPTAQEGSVIETIEETTVGDLSGQRVPMANMTQGDYTLPDGMTRRGWICALVIPGAPAVFVGAGSIVTVGDARWEVLEVKKVPGALGTVTLKRIDS